MDGSDGSCLRVEVEKKGERNGVSRYLNTKAAFGHRGIADVFRNGIRYHHSAAIEPFRHLDASPRLCISKTCLLDSVFVAVQWRWWWPLGQVT